MIQSNQDESFKHIAKSLDDSVTSSFLQSSIDSIRNSTTPIIIVLEEIDLFVAHPKQTLLYNLFDLVSNSTSTLVVVGITSRIGTLESMEKRVRSRFSGKVVHFEKISSFSGFLDIIKDSMMTYGSGEEFIKSVEDCLLDSSLNCKLNDIFIFNCNIKHVLNVIVCLINQGYGSTRSNRQLIQSSKNTRNVKFNSSLPKTKHFVKSINN